MPTSAREHAILFSLSLKQLTFGVLSITQYASQLMEISLRNVEKVLGDFTAESIDFDSSLHDVLRSG